MACSSNHCCNGKSINITYSECMFVDLGTQHAMRMRRVILSSVACPALHYFSTLSHKRTIFENEKLLNIKCVLIFPINCVWNISHSKKNSAR